TDGVNDWRASLLEADYLLRRADEKGDRNGGLDAALRVLRDAERGASSSPDGLQELARAFERVGSGTDADRGLQKLEGDFPTVSSGYLTWGAIQAARRQYGKARASLERGLAVVPAEQRLTLELALVGLQVDQGHQEEAWKTLIALHEQHPSDRSVLEQGLELG